jgi:UDP-N-acetylmuramate dehydrogenase
MPKMKNGDTGIPYRTSPLIGAPPRPAAAARTVSQIGHPSFVLLHPRPCNIIAAMKTVRAFGGAFLEATGRPLREKVGLDQFSSFRVGGPADFFFEARTEEDLKQAVAAAAREKFPFYVIGGGYNILFDDDGYRGLIVRNRAEGLADHEGRVTVVSGTGLSFLLQYSLTRGLGGLEFLAGIPGTVGGALAGNAGAFGQSIGDFLEEAVLVDPAGGERKLVRPDLGFGYRTSSLQKSRAIVLRAVINAPPGDRNASAAKIKDYLEKRRTKHPPWGTACAGSYFKNPCSPAGEKVAAGRLLEQAGAKGMAVGGAAVYEGHCNFIVNTGGARARDVLQLAEEMKERVFGMSGIRLEEEVIHVPASASLL